MDGIDFRSDTVTWPTAEMRRAMAEARVGDDVYGEDPTVNRLETVAAARVDMEAGLFVASGTMGNLVAVLAHARRGEEAIVGADAHVLQWEAGGMAALGGVVPRALATDPQGRLNPAEVDAAVRPDDPHLPRTRLILLENTYAARNGSPLSAEYFSRIREVARRHELAVHLDGARLFNAAVALGVGPAELTREVDSVSFCLSKGLCAPVGSVLCASRERIHEARRVRKALGGGMRQAGVLAAAGLVALERMTERLAEDHAHARMLADGLAELPGVRLNRGPVRTNIVYFDLAPGRDLAAPELTARLLEDHGIRLGSEGPWTLRAVTHYWIGEEEVEALLRALRRILDGGR